MEQIKSIWSNLPLHIKIAAIIGIPVAIMLVMLGKTGSLISFFESFKKSAADKSKELDTKINDSKNQESKIQGSLETLEKDKAEAIKNTEDDDAVKFHNNR